MHIFHHAGLSTINHCCLVIRCPHRPIFVVINVEIVIVVLAPTFFHAKSPLHIDEVHKLIVSQRALVPHDILMRCKWHRLGELPFTASYHLAQLIVVQFVIHHHNWFRATKVIIISQSQKFQGDYCTSTQLSFLSFISNGIPLETSSNSSKSHMNGSYFNVSGPCIFITLLSWPLLIYTR